MQPLICVSDQFPGAATAGPGTPFWEPLQDSNEGKPPTATCSGQAASPNLLLSERSPHFRDTLHNSVDRPSHALDVRTAVPFQGPGLSPSPCAPVTFTSVHTWFWLLSVRVHLNTRITVVF